MGLLKYHKQGKTTKLWYAFTYTWHKLMMLRNIFHLLDLFKNSFPSVEEFQFSEIFLKHVLISYDYAIF